MEHLPHRLTSQIRVINSGGDQWGDRCRSQITLTATLLDKSGNNSKAALLSQRMTVLEVNIISKRNSKYYLKKNLYQKDKLFS